MTQGPKCLFRRGRSVFSRGAEVSWRGAKVSFRKGAEGAEVVGAKVFKIPTITTPLMLGAEVSFHEGPKCLNEGPKIYILWYKTGWIINLLFIFYEGTEVVDVNLGAEVSFTRGRSVFWKGP